MLMVSLCGGAGGGAGGGREVQGGAGANGSCHLGQRHLQVPLCCHLVRLLLMRPVTRLAYASYGHTGTSVPTHTPRMWHTPPSPPLYASSYA